MGDKSFIMVEAGVLPEVFLRVLRAKELLAAGEAKNISKATQMADVSRSAFYKYKDSVFRADDAQKTATIHALLKDETGALQALLAGISAAGAGVLTINQSMPENGAAAVAVTVRTDGLSTTLDALCAELSGKSAVVDISYRR